MRHDLRAQRGAMEHGEPRDGHGRPEKTHGNEGGARNAGSPESSEGCTEPATSKQHPPPGRATFRNPARATQDKAGDSTAKDTAGRKHVRSTARRTWKPAKKATGGTGIRKH